MKCKIIKEGGRKPQYYVKYGNTKVRVPTKETAQRVCKKMNKR